MSADAKTPMLDDLEKGTWPSFVKEIKAASKRSNTAKDLLGILERSYKDKVTHWKHGGIVGVLGYGGGVIGRYCDLPEEFPGVAHFHTVRVNPPSGFFYTSKALKELCDICDKHGSVRSGRCCPAGWRKDPQGGRTRCRDGEWHWPWITSPGTK